MRRKVLHVLSGFHRDGAYLTLLVWKRKGYIGIYLVDIHQVNLVGYIRAVRLTVGYIVHVTDDHHGGQCGTGKSVNSQHRTGGHDHVKNKHECQKHHQRKEKPDLHLTGSLVPFTERI